MTNSTIQDGFQSFPKIYLIIRYFYYTLASLFSVVNCYITTIFKLYLIQLLKFYYFADYYCDNWILYLIKLPSKLKDNSLKTIHWRQFIEDNSLKTIHWRQFIEDNSLKTIHWKQFIENNSLKTIHWNQFIETNSLKPIHWKQFIELQFILNNSLNYNLQLSGRLGREGPVLLHAEVRPRPFGKRKRNSFDERDRRLPPQVLPAGRWRNGPDAG